MTATFHYHSLQLIIFCISAFFILTFSVDPPPVNVTVKENCVLDFSGYPYQPSGECIGSQEKVKTWGSISTTLCCRNVLNTLTLALAQNARQTGNIFIDKDPWSKCSSSFARQNSISADLCGFDNLFHGNSPCSSFSWSDIRQDSDYQNAVKVCSDFSFSFDDACTNCTAKILKARDSQLRKVGEDGNGAETAICAAAVVISIAAEQQHKSSSLADFYSCLPYLDKFAGDDGYFKIKKSVLKVVFAILVAIVTLMLIFLLVKYVTKSKPKPAAQTKETTTVWSGLYRFSKAEIENAINYSNDRKCLGRGSAGQVYRGILPSGQVVAIKHIHKSNTSDSFTREVEGLSRVRHPNLVCLFGCCIEGEEQYLVYEYCPAGNLSQHLLRKDSVLTWERRVKILRGCVLGLRYLHHYIDGCIVHRDIKLTNILLTEDMEPKLSDFGLAKMLGMEESKVFTDVRGTIGYMDPEYMSNAKLTCASDIYSFGIVALQLLSGQKVIELDLDARDQLTRKAKDASMGKRPLSDFEDPRLNGNVNKADFESILQIAVFCVAKSSEGRPTIDVVFDEIDKAWKNTVADKRTKRCISSSATPMSRSLEVVPV